MITRKKAKDLIGGTIALIPQSNAVSRTIPLREQIVERMLLKVSVKKMEVIGFEGTFYIDGSLDNNNYGYLPFENKQAALDHLDAEVLCIDLKRQSWNGITLNQAKRI